MMLVIVGVCMVMFVIVGECDGDVGDSGRVFM